MATHQQEELEQAKCKRGKRIMKLQGADGIYMVVVAIAMSLVALLCYYIWIQITTAAPTLFGANAPSIVQPITTSSTNAFKLYINMLVLIFFAISIDSIVAAFFVSSHPIFFIAGIFGTIIQITLTVVGHNIYFTIIQNSAFGSILVGLSAPLNLFFQYFPEIAFIFAIGTLIVTYGKGGASGGAASVGGGYY